jgi:hypothetical protein
VKIASVRVNAGTRTVYKLLIGNHRCLIWGLTNGCWAEGPHWYCRLEVAGNQLIRSEIARRSSPYLSIRELSGFTLWTDRAIRPMMAAGLFREGPKIVGWSATTNRGTCNQASLLSARKAVDISVFSVPGRNGRYRNVQRVSNHGGPARRLVQAWITVQTVSTDDAIWPGVASGRDGDAAMLDRDAVPIGALQQ